MGWGTGHLTVLIFLVNVSLCGHVRKQLSMLKNIWVNIHLKIVIFFCVLTRIENRGLALFSSSSSMEANNGRLCGKTFDSNPFPNFTNTHSNTQQQLIWIIMIYLKSGLGPLSLLDFVLCRLGRHLRRCHNMRTPNKHFWKWSNGIEKSERDLFWCISMSNNVKSCKKINGKVQTFRFSVFTMGGHWLTGALC